MPTVPATPQKLGPQTLTDGPTLVVTVFVAGLMLLSETPQKRIQLPPAAQQSLVYNCVMSLASLQSDKNILYPTLQPKYSFCKLN